MWQLAKWAVIISNVNEITMQYKFKSGKLASKQIILMFITEQSEVWFFNETS